MAVWGALSLAESIRFCAYSVLKGITRANSPSWCAWLALKRSAMNSA